MIDNSCQIFHESNAIQNYGFQQVIQTKPSLDLRVDLKFKTKDIFLSQTYRVSLHRTQNQNQFVTDFES